MENSIKPKEKMESMKKYKRAHFLYNLVLYSLTTWITFLFISYPFWLPLTNHFFFVSLPSFFDSKCLFVLGNIIVFILVGESKVATRSSKFISTDNVHDDQYVVRSKSFREVIKPEATGDIDQRLNIEERRIENDRNKEEKMSKDHEKNIVKRMRKVNINVGITKLEDLTEIPMEELNKRVEAFIQRVNRQRSRE